ncbi:SigE family RNA polymerase sigma factor [Kineococcus sp. SYSU DK005]|uniref:SigE family RNA polymerase sigma factor n=1 Tax=Kineococcus sp. SYSU DK005 TaxID=3383126 RepID=UPI003D7C36DC
MSRDEDFSDWAATATPQLLRLARLLSADEHAGQDLTQEVLEKVYLKWARIQDPHAYAHRALANAATSRWRRRARRPTEVAWDTGAENSAESSVPSVELGAVEDREQVLAVLRALPARQRAVLVLRYLEDRSEQDVADLLGIGAGTVKSHTARALATLRALHAPHPDPPAPSAPAAGAPAAGAPRRARAARKDAAR